VKIGVPKEIKDPRYSLGMTRPACGSSFSVAHNVIVEASAGPQRHCRLLYADAGAQLKPPMSPRLEADMCDCQGSRKFQSFASFREVLVAVHVPASCRRPVRLASSFKRGCERGYDPFSWRTDRSRCFRPMSEVRYGWRSRWVRPVSKGARRKWVLLLRAGTGAVCGHPRGGVVGRNDALSPLDGGACDRAHAGPKHELP